jgi:hypothetical protein
MRSAVVCLVGLFLVASSSALACGDKFVVFGQGVRFQRAYAAAHPANILVYLKADSKWASPENRERLLTVLRMVGHRPQAVTTLDEFQAAIARSNYDVVLTELSSVPVANETVAAAKVRPTVVPMVFEPSRAELKEIERQNSCTVAVSRRSHELLSVINDVMGQRSKGITEACQRKHA